MNIVILHIQIILLALWLWIKDSIEDVCVKVVENIREEININESVKDMEAYFGGSEEIFNNFDKYVGIILF